MQQTYDWTPLAVGVVLWVGLWIWLIWQRSSKLTVQMLFAITTGFAALSVLGTPTGQEMIHRIKYANQRHDWIILVILLTAWGVTAAVLRRMARTDND